MEFLHELGLFLAQVLALLIVLVLLLLAVVALSRRHRHGDSGGQLDVRKLNDRARDFEDTLRGALLDPQVSKDEAKARRKREKAERKARRKAARRAADAEGDSAAPPRERPVLFVLDFNGDLRASETELLREEISAILPQLRQGDEVMLRLESPGGLVHSYGLAASQLRRLRDSGHPLTVCVDRVAASGGYMMACVADRIIAAPFAVIGSVGVVAQLPNFHRLLKKNDIDFELMTAGEYKRTLTLFGENTEPARRKFREELDDTHTLFKEFIREQRPQLDVDSIATGEVWYGIRALQQGLVDELQTSDAFIQSRLEKFDVFEVEYTERQNWQERLGVAAEAALERSVLRWWQRAQRPFY